MRQKDCCAPSRLLKKVFRALPWAISIHKWPARRTFESNWKALGFHSFAARRRPRLFQQPARGRSRESLAEMMNWCWPRQWTRSDIAPQLDRQANSYNYTGGPNPPPLSAQPAGFSDLRHPALGTAKLSAHRPLASTFNMGKNMGRNYFQFISY